MPTGRTDTASRLIRAEPAAIYRALLDPAAVAAWRPPSGMRAEVYAFDAREGGTFRMAFIFSDDRHATPGKTTEHADVFEGRFTELVPDRRVVERIDFQSDDPAFAEPMTVTTELRPAASGTEVRIVCSDVPDAISEADHAVGMASTLENLAAFVE